VLRHRTVQASVSWFLDRVWGRSSPRRLPISRCRQARTGDSDYPQFERVPVPNGSDATCAWLGTIQPFATMRQARIPPAHRGKTFHRRWWREQIIAHPLWIRVIGRTIGWLGWESVPSSRSRINGSKHAKGLCVAAEISRSSHPLHPHLRPDLVITVGRRELPALCVYSGAAFSYTPGWPRIVQFLRSDSHLHRATHNLVEDAS